MLLFASLSGTSARPRSGADAPTLEKFPQPVIYGQNNKWPNIGKFMEFFVDPGGELSLEQVRFRSSQFQPVLSSYPSFGTTSARVWLRFQLNTAPNLKRAQNLLLELGVPWLVDVNFYLAGEDGRFAKESSGVQTLLQDRNYNHQNFLFKMSLQPGRKKYVYLSVTSIEAMTVPVYLWEQEAFNRIDRKRNFVFGLFFGLFLAMALYNLFLFGAVRDRTYLYYVIYVLCLTAFFASLYGQLLIYLEIKNPALLFRLTPLLSLLASSAALAFTRNYLFVKQHFPFVSRLFSLGIGFHLAGVVLLFALPQNQASNVGNIIPLFGIVLVVYSGVRMLIRGYRPALYFLIAWGVLLITVTLFILTNLNLIPANVFTHYGQLVGAAFETTLLSLGLGYRINELKRSEEEARRKFVEEQERALKAQKTMADSFARFVPQQFLKFLGRDSVIDIKHGDAVQQDMAVLFTDIRGFTSISERFASQDTFLFLNQYLEAMEPLLQQNGGFIDKFIGDAIMALFPGQSRDALAAAIAMARETRLLSERNTDPLWQELDTGIGLHRGELMLGTVGSPNRLDTTVIGDTVNLASRLEGANKKYGTRVLISDSVFKDLDNPEEFLMREVDSVLVKGKSIPVVLYEVYDADVESLRNRKQEFADDFLNAMFYFKGREFSEALRAFEAYVAKVPDDSVGELYRKRTAKFVEKPPPAKWKGVFQVW